MIMWGKNIGNADSTTVTVMSMINKYYHYFGIIRPYLIKAEEYLTKEDIPVYRHIASVYTDDLISDIDLDLTKDYP